MSHNDFDLDRPLNDNLETPFLTMCITELDVGGAEKAFVRVAAGLQSLGWRIRVISLRDAGPLAEPLRAAGISVTALQCGGFSDIRCYVRLKRELRRELPDVLLCFLHQANIYGRLAARASQVPKMVSGIRVADRRRTVALTDRMTRCCSDHYIAVSQHVAELHANLCGIPLDRMTSIPNGVDLPAQDSLSGADGDSDAIADANHRILFVGRLCQQKNPELLLSAWRRLPESLRQTAELWLVGDGPLRESVQRMAAQDAFADRIRLTGPRDDIPELMQSASLLVLPSRWEGMPNVVLEAMAASLPVVATNVDGTQELLKDGESGWLVGTEDAEALASAIVAALSQPDERRRRARNARDVAATRFTWSGVVQQYDAVLRAIVGGAKTGLAR